MTQDDAIEKLCDITTNLKWDVERAHSQADKVLLEFLRANGCDAVADAWQECHDAVKFWYA